MLALLTGATIGAGLGILFAPYKGSKTRRKIKRSVSDTSQNVSEFVKDAKDAIR